MTQNQIDHVALVLDASASMGRLSRRLIEVVDAQITYLARRSKELNREVRVSVYTFNYTVICEIFDKDVLRLPSIAPFYRTSGATALIDATLKSQLDLDDTSVLYGDHAFLTFVLTDGEENRSRLYTGDDLKARLAGQADNYTVAVLVPDQRAVFNAKGFGFPAGNIAIWDSVTEAGVTEVGETIRAATETFMAGRVRGVRGSRSVFSTGADAVNAQTVKSALAPLSGDKYRLIPVAVDDPKVRVDEFIRDVCGMDFRLGTVYYQWSKRETVQPQKRLAVVEKRTDRVYIGTGEEIRQMIGLPSMSVKDAPQANPDYDIFVQSTAPNRKLVAHTKVLVML